MADQVLSLSTTKFDRPTINVDGVSYEMRSRQELSVQMMLRMQELGTEESENGDVDLIERAAALADAVDVVIVDFPKEVRDKLVFGQHLEIVQAFNKLIGDDNPVSTKAD